MECPIVKRTELQLIDMDEEGFVTLMDDAGETRDDLQATDLEVKKEIQAKIDAEEDALVCVLSVSIYFPISSLFILSTCFLSNSYVQVVRIN